MFKVSDAVKVKNEGLEAHGRAGCVVGFGAGETAGMVEVRLDGDDEALAFAPADLEKLSN
ncbi:hypothetical protein [Hydrogenophaga intermedia]|uniref:hypothetical protein n=1 Tax=Hydrogenophaga intermedia TaxID=65786 RepID=UPI0020436F61|nr:hypothetical protein [Hydrogenophaga intermedia]MCM3565935.1 hypothetical protein [Hydrogenophaga intermedia]